ncbi:helix-turn-helix domain-containing protein [Nitratireductor pacificus]|uniref:Transcriptional regulator n=1 Tax=Nitratireductor pacificus pht-3B TaxID=391937 RepID=K2MH09_9HYPH|nr:XRE family transcriptional regulator [Nitratireductor pacificus]EKF20000.1 transcriptional regulator [Nitratireductor pacificus pht-3B]
MSSQTARAGAEPETRIGVLIRARRRQLGLTLQQLGDAANLSVGYLSQVERDNATPTLGTLAGIARALGVGLDYFVAQPRAEDALTREEARPRFSIAGSSLIYERLGTEFPGNQLSSFILTVPPGYVSETVSHEGEELIYILEGSIIQSLDGQEMVMKAGDSLHYRGNTPHAWKNPNDTPARLLWAGTLTLFNAAGQPASHITLVSRDKAGKPASPSSKRKPGSTSRTKEEKT